VTTLLLLLACLGSGPETRSERVWTLQAALAGARARADTDGDGVITAAELPADTDGDGAVDDAELFSWLGSAKLETWADLAEPATGAGPSAPGR
jgi:hypothetical protein